MSRIVDKAKARGRLDPSDIELTLSEGAGPFVVRTLSISFLASLVPALYVALRDVDGRLSVYSALVFLAYGLACWPAYRGLTTRLRRERVRLAAREAGLVDADALIAVARDLPSLGDLPRMARRLTLALREAFGADTAALLVADPQRGQLQTLVSDPGDTETTRELPVLLPTDDAGLEVLRRAGRPLETDELRSHSPELDRHLAALDARLLVPLVHQNSLVGVLVLGPPSRAPIYTSAQRELLDLVAHHVSTIFENARLFTSVTYENLTGLMRREAILERLENEFARADRYARPLAVCLIDLDHFKQVNDRLGHLAGDIALRSVAAEISSTLRTSDCAGRYGGEEFLVVFPETGLPQALLAAEKIRRRIGGLSIEVGANTTIGVRVSIGVASLDSIDDLASPPASISATSAVDRLIATADHALYRAKEGGRDRVEPSPQSVASGSNLHGSH